MGADFFIRGDTKLDTKGFSDAVQKLEKVSQKGFSTVTQMSQKANTALGMVATTSQDTSNALKSTDSSVEKLGHSFSGATTEIKKNSEKVKENIQKQKENSQEQAENARRQKENSDKTKENSKRKQENSQKNNENSDTTEKNSEKVKENTKHLEKWASVSKTAMSVVTKAWTGAVATLGAVATAGITYNATMEQFQTAFTTMLGSSESSDKLTNSLKTLAAATPLAMSDLAGATKTLLAFGSSAEDIPDQLKRLGDVAQGNAQALGTMATAFGRIQSNGKASMEEINMMIDQGFNPLTIIAKKTGETMEQVRKRVSDGGVSFEELSDALKIATDEGGQFYNAMENQSKTIKGRLSTLKDNAMALAGGLSEGMTQGFAGLIETAIGWIDKLNQVMAEKGIGGVIDAAGSILAEATVMLADAAPKFMKTSVDLLTAFINGLVKSLPKLVPAAGKIIQTLASGILQMAPVLFSALSQLGNMLVTGIQSILPTLSENISSFLQTVLPKLLSFSEGLREKIGDLVDLGLQLIQNFWNGIVQALPALIENVPQIITNIAGIINDNFPKILATGVSMVWELIKGILSSIPNIIAAIPQIIEAIVSVFTAFNWVSLGSNIIQLLQNGITAMTGAIGNTAKSIFETVKNIIANLPNTLKNIGSSSISAMANAIRGMLSAVIGAAKSILTGIVNAIFSLPKQLQSIAKDAISKVWTAFTSTDWGSIGGNIIKGIIGGIGGAVGGLVDSAVNAAKSAFDAAKNFLGIHSPSRLFRDQIGKMIPAGMAVGIETDTDKAVNSVKLSAEEMVHAAQNAILSNQIKGMSTVLQIPDLKQSNSSAPTTVQTEHTTVVQLDGRTVGKVVAPYIDEFLF